MKLQFVAIFKDGSMSELYHSRIELESRNKFRWSNLFEVAFADPLELEDINEVVTRVKRKLKINRMAN